MKKLFVVFAFVSLGVSNVFSQKSFDAIFDRYADDERFTYVSVGRGAFNLVKSFAVFSDLSSEEMNMVSKMNGVKILTLENAGNLSVSKKIQADVDKLVKTDKYEAIAEVRDKGDRTLIFVAVDKTELVVLSRDNKEFSLIWLTGTK